MEMEELPAEILAHIFSFLDAKFLQRVVPKVCTAFRKLVEDQALWKIRMRSTWPDQYPPLGGTEDGGAMEEAWDEACVEREEFERRFSGGGLDEVAPLKPLVLRGGHYSTVDSLLILRPPSKEPLVLSGSRDRSICVWDTSRMRGLAKSDSSSGEKLGLVQTKPAHAVRRTWSEISGQILSGETSIFF